MIANAAYSENYSSDAGYGNNTFKAYYFYSPTCLHCERIAPFMKCEESKFERNMELIRLDVNNEENANLYRKLAAGYGVPIEKATTPTMFIGDKILVGDAPIAKSFEDEIARCISNACKDPIQVTNGIEITEANYQPDLVVITVLAITDSINPCAFAVLLFLLTYISSIGSTKRAIKVALVYISAVFISYLLAGLGISFLTVLFLPLRSVIILLAGAFAVTAGILNIKDYFFYGKWFSLQIPKKYGPVIERYSKKASIPGAIVLGFIVSAVELPCTGFAYFAAIGILTKYDMLERVPWLVYYNIIFVIPLFVIIALYLRGFSPEVMESWREDRKNQMKLVLGLVLVLIGLMLVLQSYSELLGSIVDVSDCKSLVGGF